MGLAEDDNGRVVATVGDLLRRKEQGLDDLPGEVKVMLERGAWQRFNGGAADDPQTYGERDFAMFVQTPWPRGLGCSVELLQRIVDGTDAMVSVRQALKHKPGPNSHSNRRQVHQGTTRAYRVERLQRERPDLAARVVLPKGDPNRLSANAAFIEAGWDSHKVEVPLGSPERAARLLTKPGRYNAGELITALRELTSRGQRGV